jgi:ATP-dependent DNA helicase PIF1
MSKIWFVVSNGSEVGIYDDWEDVCLFGISTIPGMRLWTCSTKEQARKILQDEEARNPICIDEDASGSTTIDMQLEREMTPPPFDDDVDVAPITVPHKRPRIEEFAFDANAEASTSTKAPTLAPARSRDLCSADQIEVLKLVERGESVFFTGAAGTGKSYLIGCIIEELRSRCQDARSVAVTATTGAAAVNIGGVTIHSMAGIGLGTESAGVLAARSLSSKKASAAIGKCNTLIIDEISMLPADVFDKLEYVFRYVKCKGRNAHTERRWGGVQVILSGDFLQLPPVQRQGDAEVQFAFQSEAWKQSIKHMRVLRNQHRQHNADFISALEELRHGVCSDKTRAMLQARVGAVVADPLILYSRTDDVERENARGLAALGDVEQMTFKAKDYYSYEMSKEQQVRASALWPVAETLLLKVGARVMLLRNLAVSRGLCNGSQGVVTAFVYNSTFGAAYPRVRFRNGVELVVTPEDWTTMAGDVTISSRSQVPLTLAYALTIHKSQGCTLDAAKCNIANTFAGGQAYVAVSRTRTIEGLSISAVPASFKVNEVAVAFHRRIGD